MVIRQLLGSAIAIQLVMGCAGLAAGARIARASADLDRRYALETIGALRSWDNVDGLFADYVASAYKDYFSRQTRFRAVDLSKADSLLAGSKLPYAKAIEDPGILGSLARSLRIHSLIRTRIFKEGPRYRFTIEWLHSPQMDVLASDTFNLEDMGGSRSGEPSDGSGARDFAGLGDIKGKLQSSMERMFAKVPFVGHVTGRDNDDITVNLGGSASLRRGDTLILGTIDEVKKHPLLKEVVEWRMTPTGKAEIDSVDEALSFAHVIAQEEGREISRYQKVMKVVPKPEPAKADPARDEAPVNPMELPPKLGFGQAAIWTGVYSRQLSDSTGVSNSGSGFLYGARGSGQLWFNREFFIDADFGYGAFSLSQTDANGQTLGTGASATILTFCFDLGYTYFLSEDFFGPRAWVKAGYKGTSVSLPASATDHTAPYGNNAIFLGLGGDLPIREKYGIKIDLKFGLFNMASEADEPHGGSNSSHNVAVYFGGYYRFKPRIHFGLGLEIEGTGTEFDLETTPVLSQKTITVLPAIKYLF